MTHEALSNKLRDTLLESGKPIYDDDRISWNGIGVLTKIWQAYVSYLSDRAYRQPTASSAIICLLILALPAMKRRNLTAESSRDIKASADAATSSSRNSPTGCE